MINAEFQLRGFGDPRLSAHATSALPAWLWSSDGTRVLWANPVGARAFGAANSTALARKIFGPADPHRRQVARLAGRLLANGAVRLERLQGFGAAPGMLATCGCSRLDLPDGSHGILVAASNGSGRIMPLTERLQHLVEGLAMPVAAFTREGMLIGTSDAARCGGRARPGPREAAAGTDGRSAGRVGAVRRAGRTAGSARTRTGRRGRTVRCATARTTGRRRSRRRRRAALFRRRRHTCGA